MSTNRFAPFNIWLFYYWELNEHCNSEQEGLPPFELLVISQTFCISKRGPGRGCGNDN